MATPKKVVSYAETQAAQAFLKLVGAATSNPSTIAAVIAWYRTALASSKDADNPFRLQPGTYDQKYRSGTSREIVGYRWVEDDSGALVKTPIYQSYSTYATQTAALQGLAGYVLSHLGEYGPAVRYLRLGDVNGFFRALARTGLGYVDPATGQSRVGGTYAGYGQVVLHPAQPGQPAPKPLPVVIVKPPPAPPPTRNLLNRVPRRDYLSPYAARNFYDARHRDEDARLVP